MSGGSYDYAYSKVDDMAGSLSGVHESALRRAFRDHLFEVSRVMRVVEWADSLDTNQEEADVAMRKLLGQAAEIEAATEIAKRAMDQLRHLIFKATQTDHVSNVGDEG